MKTEIEHYVTMTSENQAACFGSEGLFWLINKFLEGTLKEVCMCTTFRPLKKQFQSEACVKFLLTRLYWVICQKPKSLWKFEKSEIEFLTWGNDQFQVLSYSRFQKIPKWKNIAKIMPCNQHWQKHKVSL